ncbi:MAG: hypothetical protein ACREP3_14715 [Candidatus Binatia bacterium]
MFGVGVTLAIDLLGLMDPLPARPIVVPTTASKVTLRCRGKDT